MTSLHRRRFLELSAAAVTVSLAGCSTADGQPSYAKWVPASSDQVRTAYLDFTISKESPKADELLPLVLPSNADGQRGQVLTQVAGIEDIDDPLLTWPIGVGGRFVAVGTLTIGAAGLGYLVDPEDPTHRLDELMVVNNTIVGTGDIDLERADEGLRDGGDGIAIQHERAGDLGDFRVYEAVDDETGGVVAVSENAILVAGTREKIRRLVATSNGNRPRAASERETFEWLTETVGAGFMVAGWTGSVSLDGVFFGDPAQRPASDVVRTEDDVLSSLQFDTDAERITATIAIQRSEMNDGVQKRLQSTFGGSGADSSLTFENQRMTASRTYANEAIAFEFSDPNATAGRGDERVETVDPPEKVANAVPDDAFEFTYEPEQDRVKLAVVKQIEADSITISAVESDYEFETEDPSQVNFVYVYVDDERDQVVVTVTVDGVSGVVATREFPREN